MRQLVPSPSAGAARQRGLTLLEVMIAMAIMAILAGLAVPAYYNSILSMRLSSYANDMVASSLLARSEAIKRNAVVSLCVSANGTSCTTGNWNQGWIVMCKSSDMVVCDGGTQTLVIKVQEPLTTGWNLTESSSLSTIDYQPIGTSSTAANFLLCRATPTPGYQERVISVSATGRPAVKTTTTGTCT